MRQRQLLTPREGVFLMAVQAHVSPRTVRVSTSLRVIISVYGGLIYSIGRCWLFGLSRGLLLWRHSWTKCRSVVQRLAVLAPNVNGSFGMLVKHCMVCISLVRLMPMRFQVYSPDIV